VCLRLRTKHPTSASIVHIPSMAIPASIHFASALQRHRRVGAAAWLLLAVATWSGLCFLRDAAGPSLLRAPPAAASSISKLSSPLVAASASIRGRAARRPASTLQRAASVTEAAPLPLVVAEGEPNTPSFRLSFLSPASRAKLSPWHDVPLNTEVPTEKWMVTEIPRLTKAKMEIATKEEHNPIAQDVKDGKLRDYHGPIYWNYGCFPQTWEDPSVEHPELGVLGDNDPLDVVEIGRITHQPGDIRRVKVLGALAMIDSGELDWKIFAIDCEDPLASELHSMGDLEALLPEVVAGIREWFRWYKLPDGKALNEFGFGGRALSTNEALAVIDETHEAWKKLRSQDDSLAGGLWTGRR